MIWFYITNNEEWLSSKGHDSTAFCFNPSNVCLARRQFVLSDLNISMLINLLWMYKHENTFIQISWSSKDNYINLYLFFNFWLRSYVMHIRINLYFCVKISESKLITIRLIIFILCWQKKMNLQEYVGSLSSSGWIVKLTTICYRKRFAKSNYFVEF